MLRTTEWFEWLNAVKDVLALMQPLACEFSLHNWFAYHCFLIAILVQLFLVVMRIIPYLFRANDLAMEWFKCTYLFTLSLTSSTSTIAAVVPSKAPFTDHISYHSIFAMDRRMRLSVVHWQDFSENLRVGEQMNQFHLHPCMELQQSWALSLAQVMIWDSDQDRPKDKRRFSDPNSM